MFIYEELALERRSVMSLHVSYKLGPNHLQDNRGASIFVYNMTLIYSKFKRVENSAAHTLSRWTDLQLKALNKQQPNLREIVELTQKIDAFSRKIVQKILDDEAQANPKIERLLENYAVVHDI